ncbi:hypothetical protein AB9Q10_10955 [Streptomyces krungchingensis]|uniref:hypothetical protein n=1 Tax=Streptomyces TaxID=1883 RepID=UPI003CF9E9A6
MHAIRVASAALLGVTFLACAAPAALADDGSGSDITPFGFAVQPSTVVAGGQVSLQLKRDSGGCSGAATVSSGVFDTVSIPAAQSSATVVVDRNAKPGAVYEVTFSCGGTTGHTDLAIAGGGSADVTTVPAQQGVDAGVGGSSDGFDLREIGLGAALVTGSIGAAWYVARRRATPDDS